MTKLATFLSVVILHRNYLPTVLSASGGLRDKKYAGSRNDEEHRMLAPRKFGSSPTPAPVSSGTCGNGDRGNGICPDTSLCCSQYGWCGSTSNYCSSGTGPSPTPAPITSGTCGNGSRGNGICPDMTLCCSQYGWCGSTPDYCSSRTGPNPTPAPVTTGTCGGGSRGNGICPDTTLCCSQYGWCGSTPDYCSSGTGPSPTPAPVNTGTCGNGNRGNGICPDTTLCCSQYGWCGSTPDYCSGGTSPTQSPGGTGVSSPPRTLSVGDLQVGFDVYGSFWGSNALLADQARVDQINAVTTNTQNGWTLYRQIAFVAQTIWESGAYVYTEEQAAVNPPYTNMWNYQDCDWNQAGIQYPANGKAFYGRGYIQLSWCANYKAYGKGRMINGDADYFYNNPELVATIYAMDSAAWFFENFVTDTTGQFGLTTKDINGAIECSAGYTGNTPQRRYQIFDAIAKKVGLTGYSSAGC